MSSDYLQEKLQEAIENQERSIADLTLELSRNNDPNLRRQLESKERELQQLRAQGGKESKLQSRDEALTHTTPQSITSISSIPTEKKERQEASSSNHPSQILVVVTLLGLFVVLVGTLTLSAYYLKDPLLIFIVFLVSLISLVVLLPFIGLNTAILREETWFKTYIAALEKIPGLDVLIDAWAKKPRK